MTRKSYRSSEITEAMSAMPSYPTYVDLVTPGDIIRAEGRLNGLLQNKPRTNFRQEGKVFSVTNPEDLPAPTRTYVLNGSIKVIEGEIAGKQSQTICLAPGEDVGIFVMYLPSGETKVTLFRDFQNASAFGLNKIVNEVAENCPRAYTPPLVPQSRANKRPNKVAVNV